MFLSRQIKAFNKINGINSRLFSSNPTPYIKYYDTTGQKLEEKTEKIITNQEFPITRCKEILKNKTVAVLGYGPQGKAQSLNLKSNNIDVIVGVRTGGDSWHKAIEDGWAPNKNLFDIDEASFRGNIVKYLLSDSGQIKQWGKVKNNLNMGDTLYFSHGFGVHYYNYTNINPPDDVNVVMVSPKCSGDTVRKNFLNKKGIASSYAIYKDFDNAEDICRALAFSIGNNYIFETTFEKEVVSDLTGERCVLMGLIQGAFLAQYNVLRENGHSPLEAYHETVEEALQSLYPLIKDKGMDWMYKNCSTTAQRGALDWAPIFEENIKPVISDCYDSVKNNVEVERVVVCNSNKNYREELNKELESISSQEVWQIGKQLRKIKNNINETNKLRNNGNLRWNGIHYESAHFYNKYN
tara:strand:- start:1821 stop:3047 length:1227 start_codon:yes stop_codon:yes gene_type:complete